MATTFQTGKSYVFYKYSQSSQAEVVTCQPAFAPVYKYLFQSAITGESTAYNKEDTTAEEIAEKYQAKLLFSEKVNHTTNYYYYSPLLGDGVDVGGAVVNLHIADGVVKIVVGTPLIFGGY